MKPLAACDLYTFVDIAYVRGRDVATMAQQLCDGGSDLIQLRAKQSAPDEIRRFAEKILPITRRANVGLVINDHPDIAQQVGADLCHLGQEDFFGARPSSSSAPQLSTINNRLLVGLSTHSPAQASRALLAQPAYIAIGPVYATPTKPQAPPVTLDYVRWAAGNVTIPWFAIGGIHLNNLDEVLAAGARRICVVSAILNATDVAAACRAFRARLEHKPATAP